MPEPAPIAVIAVCVAAAIGCTQELPRAIDAILVPPLLRVGSPIEVRGHGLAGTRLRLTDAPVDVTWTTVEASDADFERATGYLPDSPHWRSGQRFGGACLTGAQWTGWQACAAIDARFRADWKAGAVSWLPASLAWGATLTVHAEDLLLPREGPLWVEVDDGLTVRSATLATSASAGRGRGALAVQPSWTGALPGTRTMRIRLGGSHRGHVSTGPWSSWLSAQLAAPQIAAAGKYLHRGSSVPLTIKGIGENAHLHWQGVWRAAGGQPVATWDGGPPLDFSGPAAVLRSKWYAVHLADLVAAGANGFQGHVVGSVGAHGQAWTAAPVAVDWALRPLQRVELVAGPGLQAALHRLGLAALAPHVHKAVLDRLQSLFAAFSVQVGWRSPLAPAGERLIVHLQDRDPNGLGLLGAESSVAKDTGNLVLDEQLGGINRSAFSAGQAAYGGVFAGELLAFSKTLHGASPMADAAFDQAIGRWCPQLGGKPAGVPDLEQAAQAIAVIANVIAEVTAHEIGHALGLPTGTQAAHHAGDNPGWIMDAGSARPFAERAAMPGATPSQWGPVDAPYLAAILSQ